MTEVTPNLPHFGSFCKYCFMGTLLLVTLYHWDLPTALYRQGGWKNPASPDWFAEYAEVVSKALAGRVEYWLTFNEPQMFCGLGLVAGVHAPFEHNDDQTMMGITKHILLAHGRAVQMLRRNCPGTRVGMAPTGDCCLPKDDSPEEVEKARQKSLSDYPGYIMSNTWWADPVFLGQYPAWAKEKFGDQLYTMTPEEWTLVSQPLDFYAYNCYQGTVDIVPDPSKYDAYAYQGSPQTAAAWNITPKVLYHASKFWFEQRVMPKEEALQTVHGYVEHLARTSHKQLAALLHIPGLYRLVPGVFVKSTRSVFGPAAGFAPKELQTGNGVWRVDMMKCPYHDTCAEYGCPELCRCFCDSDDISYTGLHPKLIWERSMTLGRGNDHCDFCMKVR